MSRVTPFALGALALVAGCDSSVLDPMRDQPALRGYEPSALFQDGRSFRAPPAGTIPRERHVGPALAHRGYEETTVTEGAVPLGPVLEGATLVRANAVSTAYATRPPMPVTMELLRRGRQRFEIVCANCHGVLGDGETIVARQMELRRPPSLLAQPLRDYPVGRLFRIASEGFGMMPAFAQELTFEDRWAVATYIKALQLSQSATGAELPPEAREEVAR